MVTYGLILEVLIVHNRATGATMAIRKSFVGQYNIRDVEVTKAISEKLNILSFCEALWSISWCDFRHLNANSVLNDCYFNKRMWEDNVLVTKADLEYKGRFGGGFNYFKDE